MEKVFVEFLVVIDMIVLNEMEMEILIGIVIIDEVSMLKVFVVLYVFGILVVIIMIGSKGVFYDIDG